MASFRLKPQQVAQYHSDGYLVLRAEEHSLVDPQQLRAWTTEVREWPREKGKWMPYEEVNVNGERQLLRTENFVDYHEHFHELLRGPALTGILKQITGDDMLLFKDKINYKLANGNGFEAHLDAPAYDHIGKIEHTTVNLAVDEATPENGCLEVVRGSHKMNVDLAHGGRIASAWEKGANWIQVPLKPGDMLIFGSHLAHRSAPNRTTKSRSSIYATFHQVGDGTDLRQKYYVDRRENFPPEHEREAGKDYEAGWKRYGFAAPFSKTKQEPTNEVRLQAVR